MGRHLRRLGKKAIGLILTIFLGVLVARPVFAQEPKFVPPPAEQISTLLEFSGPVSLVLHVMSKEELERKPRKGVPRVAYTYSAPAQTSQSFSIAVYLVGDFLGERRAELAKWIAQLPAPERDGIPAAGAYRTSDGRSIFQFPLSFGPGGESEGALLQCRNPRYEIVVFQNTDYHKDQDPKLFAHHVKPRKQLREVIEAIEGTVLQ